MYKSNYDLLI